MCVRCLVLLNVTFNNNEKHYDYDFNDSHTSVAPCESCWLTSSPRLINSWISPSILLSVDARVSFIISWVMPVSQADGVTVSQSAREGTGGGGVGGLYSQEQRGSLHPELVQGVIKHD